jgi:hypothetical protein
MACVCYMNAIILISKHPSVESRLCANNTLKYAFMEIKLLLPFRSVCTRFIGHFFKSYFLVICHRECHIVFDTPAERLFDLSWHISSQVKVPLIIRNYVECKSQLSVSGILPIYFLFFWKCLRNHSRDLHRQEGNICVVMLAILQISKKFSAFSQKKHTKISTI